MDHKMDKKSNMKQAMFEMFGVGSDANAQPAQPAKAEPKAQPAAKEEVKAPAAAAQPAKKAADKGRAMPAEKPAASYFAPGTSFEGTLRSAGDIEIAGNFKGDISTEGTVVLRSNLQGNITASSLDLSGCKLEGDAIVKGLVFISHDSVICGNVTADELTCAGQITGDLKIKDSTLIEGTAKINGNVSTGTIAVVKGAVINGGIAIKASDA